MTSTRYSPSGKSQKQSATGFRSKRPRSLAMCRVFMVEIVLVLEGHIVVRSVAYPGVYRRLGSRLVRCGLRHHRCCGVVLPVADVGLRGFRLAILLRLRYIDTMRVSVCRYVLKFGDVNVKVLLSILPGLYLVLGNV